MYSCYKKDYINKGYCSLNINSSVLHFIFSILSYLSVLRMDCGGIMALLKFLENHLSLLSGKPEPNMLPALPKKITHSYLANYNYSPIILFLYYSVL